MTKRTINDIFYKLNDLWWNDWRKMDCLQSLSHSQGLPTWYWAVGEWNERMEVLYWEPPYHPIIAIAEVMKTLLKLEKEVFQGYVDFVSEIEPIIRVCNKIVPHEDGENDG